MINPNISLAARAPEFASGVTNAINIFENALMNSQTRDIRQAQSERAAELAPLNLQQAEDVAAQSRNQRILKSVNDFAIGNQSIINETVNKKDPVPLQRALAVRRGQLQQQGLPTDETDEAIIMLGQGNIDGVVSALSDSVKLYNQSRGQGASAGTREFQNLLSIAQDPNATQLEQDSARRKLGDLERKSISAEERIATDKFLGKQVAEQQAAETTAIETGKAKTQLKFKPQITREVKLAEKAAIERGEVLTDLGRMEAALPGVQEVVSGLKELAPLVTSTLAGGFFDQAVKQTGFGSTKGANAKAKFIAIIDNQVLPLLKETFGSAFTVQEGENLKASLADPEASPDQKIEQLNAFIAQKERNIRTKQEQLGQEQQPSGVVEFQEGARATNPSTGEVIVFTNNEWVTQ
jgi:hypothetical protein